DAGLIGGGSYPRPGEVSLEHGGVLFLDELPEFRKNVLEVLRQPMEDGVVTIARAAMSLTYPARFMLAAAMNPCPCGYFGDPQHTCVCGHLGVERYLARVSGPLLDRIDLHLEVPAVKYRALADQGGGEASEAVRERVDRARAVQRERFAPRPGVYANAHMAARDIRTFCRVSDGADALRASADVLVAGLKVYRDGCSGCHGGPLRPSEWGISDFYPRVPQFARTPPRKPAWQLYWIVQHGVRYSGMAGWGNQIPDSSIWQVVSFLTRLDSLPPAIDVEWRKVGG